MSGTVEQIKAKLSIVDVISSYLKLEKAGANWKACCPFHNEKTPSFFVSPSRDSYHCFGCNRGGDIFNFVQDVEGLDFVGSLKVLAERAGVSLGTADWSLEKSKAALYRVLDVAKQFYQSQLPLNPPGQSYLTDRGLTKETISAFGLGFAPAGWQGLYNFLQSRGFNDHDMLSAGLVSRSTKSGAAPRCYDRFRGRLMFPLFDGSGRTVGFSGRIFVEEPGSTEAKYVNSPQTAVYDKSRLLYGYHTAKLAIGRENACVLVEGQFDLLLSQQAGVTNTVAVSGTALTEHHLALIKRLSRNLLMAFDGDQAGLSASRRGVELSLAAGFEVKIVVLPPGRDPADIASENPTAWRERVALAKHVIDFTLENIHDRSLDSRQRAHAIREEVYPYIARLAYRTDQDHFIAKAALIGGLREETIRADLGELTLPQLASVDSAEPLSSPTREERLISQIVGLLWWQESKKNSGTGEWRKQLESLPLNFRWPEKEKLLVSRQEELILVAELTYEGKEPVQLQGEFEELVRYWQIEVWRHDLAKLMTELGQAEATGDEKRVVECLAACQAISQKISQFDKIKK